MPVSVSFFTYRRRGDGALPAWCFTSIGDRPARMISYVFPGQWAEDYFAETSRQNESGKHDPRLIKERFGVVYL